MARDETPAGKLDDLSDAEIARIEGAVFCSGGPPASLPGTLLNRACAQRRPVEDAPTQDARAESRSDAAPRG